MFQKAVCQVTATEFDDSLYHHKDNCQLQVYHGIKPGHFAYPACIGL